MKFGEALYQRSVPKWAAYNFKYNDLKYLIKAKTSAGQAVPVHMTTDDKSRWEELENELLRQLKDEYEHVTLFLRCKQGEIERRLKYLGKEIRKAQRAVADEAFDRPILQARKHQRLVKGEEETGDEIQNLARFATVQKTAFRKILKKYRKWTGSMSLQTRVDIEVFSSDKLRTDYSDYLDQLIIQTTILREELAGPMLKGRTRESSSDRQKRMSDLAVKRSSIAQIMHATLCGPLAFDAAILNVPYGEEAGSAFYWTHPDNLDETRTLLLRHMRDASALSSPPRIGPNESPGSHEKSSCQGSSFVHTILFDNTQRFIQDTSSSRPTRIALNAHWSSDPDAAISGAYLYPTSAGGSILSIKRKDLPLALQREHPVWKRSGEVEATRNYLTAHRDVKALAEYSTARSRYIGVTNSADGANWATLDTSIMVAPPDLSRLGNPKQHSRTSDAFPYAVLHIRWESTSQPDVIRVLDESHLVERVRNFTLEDMAVHTVQKELPKPTWHSLLGKDIRKVPPVPKRFRPGTANRLRKNHSDVNISSGPSSTDGPAGSVFSATQGQASATSEDFGVSDGMIVEQSTPAKPKLKGHKRKQRARIRVPERDSLPIRCWNEFDDGDSDANPEEDYVIYVNPNEPAFPATETVSKAFRAIHDSLNRGKGRVISWLPLSLKLQGKQDSARTPLLSGQQNPEGDLESTCSDTDELITPQPQRTNIAQRAFLHALRSDYRPGQLLSPRQKALERTLFQFYSVLITISFALLLISCNLLSNGRKKASIKVNAGVLVGVITAETCIIISMVLFFMRKQRLSVFHSGLFGVSVAAVVVMGVALLVQMFRGAHRCSHWC